LQTEKLDVKDWHILQNRGRKVFFPCSRAVGWIQSNFSGLFKVILLIHSNRSFKSLGTFVVH
jgi:hypothetical protein